MKSMKWLEEKGENSGILVARGGIEPPTHGFSVRFKLLLLNLIGLYQLLLIVELQSIKA